MPTYASNPRTLVDPRTSSMADRYAEEAKDQVFEPNLILNLFYNIGRKFEKGVNGSGLAEVISAMRAPRPVVRYENSDLVQIPLLFGQSTNSMAFDGGDALSTNIDEGITKAWSEWAFYTDYATLYQTDVWRNMGQAKLLDRQMEQIDAMYRSLGLAIETDWWSTNTDVAIGSQKEIPGVRHLLGTTAATGTRLGVNAANFTFWRHNVDTVGSFATNGLDKLDSMWQSCSGNAFHDPPNLHVTTGTVLRYYNKNAEGIHRITTNLTSVDLGVGLSFYKQKPVVACDLQTSGQWHMFNTNYLRMYVHSGANLVTEKPASPNNQAIAMQTRCFIGLTWGYVRADRHGLLSSITA